MARVAVLASYAPSLVNFRGALLAAVVNAGHDVAAMAPEIEPAMYEALVGMGAHPVEVPLERTGMNALSDARALRRLTAVMEDVRPDVVLSYTVKPVVYGSLAAKRARVQRIFSLVTGLGYAFSGESVKQRVLRRFLLSLYRRAFRRNSGIFFQNADDRELFAREGCLPPQVPVVVVNGSGVDVERFRFSEVASGDPVFLFVGRMLREKGVSEFIAAARELRARYPQVRAQLLGPYDSNPGGLDPKVVQGAVAEGVVEYLGSAADVRPYLARCTALVLPSYREGTPRSVLEAMAVGRAVITTDVPGCRQTVVAGRTGLLVPPRNVPALVQAMETLVANRGLAARMGKAARHRAESEYDVHKVNEVMLRAMGLS